MTSRSRATLSWFALSIVSIAMERPKCEEKINRKGIALSVVYLFIEFCLNSSSTRINQKQKRDSRFSVESRKNFRSNIPNNDSTIDCKYCSLHMSMSTEKILQYHSHEITSGHFKPALTKNTMGTKILIRSIYHNQL